MEFGQDACILFDYQIIVLGYVVYKLGRFSEYYFDILIVSIFSGKDQPVAVYSPIVRECSMTVS